jgi:hypothetical protein
MSLVQKYDETCFVTDNPKRVVKHKQTGRIAGKDVPCAANRSNKFKEVNC